MAYTKVDLGSLPAPQVLETLDYEAILENLKASVEAIMPELGPVLRLESEPAVKVLQVCAVFIMLTRARVNDAAKALLLPYATGADLEQLGSMFGVARMVIEPATDTEDAVLEPDDELRNRIQLSLEGFSTAGPRGAYEFHARSAHEDILDVMVAGPDTEGLSIDPGNVVVYVLGRDGSGIPDPEVLEAVADALNAEDVRPLCDTVTVAAASVAPFSVVAQLHMPPGPGAEAVLEEARDELEAYLESVHRIGAVVAMSGIHAALHRAGVINVTVTSPVADIVSPPNVAPFATSTNITIAS